MIWPAAIFVMPALQLPPELPPLVLPPPPIVLPVVKVEATPLPPARIIYAYPVQFCPGGS